MGYEGQATAAYWPAISALAHPDFCFVTRRRRPAPDAANIALNMLASLLARDIGMAVLAADLHPGFGALHESDDQHDAAVYDLMEEFRGHMVEGLFVYVSNRRILRADMFSAGIGGLRMASAGTAALIRAYETRASSLVASTSRGGARKVSLRQRMIEQAQRLAAHHEGRSDYVPYEIPF
jgi:CRISPR-associated protein Cas1